MGVLIIPTATTSDRTSIVPAVGELIYDTDDGNIYKGDGVTAGGVDLTSSPGAGALLAVNNLSDVANAAAALANIGGIDDLTLRTTARQFVAGQGLTNVALPVVANTISIDFQAANSFTVAINAAANFAIPANDRPIQTQVWIEQIAGGGHAVTFDPAFVVKGDTLTTGLGDKALINIASDGAGSLVAVITNLQ